MKTKLFIFFLLSCMSVSVSAALNLNVKIEQKRGLQTIESVQKIRAAYGEDVVINHDGLKNKIVLKLNKFSNINVNGNSSNPVQVDLRLVDEKERTLGKSQTVTSFYRKAAKFSLKSEGGSSEQNDLVVSLSFEEVN